MALTTEVRTSAISPGVGAADLTPVVRAVDVPHMGRMETVQPATPPDSVQMSPDSPQTVAFEDMAVSSVPMSPVQTPAACFPFSQGLNTFSDPVLGDPVAFALCAPFPGSDTPITVPVYTLPSGLALMPGQSSVQTVMASAVSSRPEG